MDLSVIGIEKTPIMLFHNNSGVVVESNELRNHRNSNHKKEEYIYPTRKIISQ